MSRALADYRVIRSRRKSLSMQVTEDGLVVRAPYFVSSAQIERFVQEHASWAEKQLAKQQQKRAALAGVKRMTPAQFERLKKIARVKTLERIAYYAPMAGVERRFKRLFIRCQKTKWGSCSANGNININCLLLLGPPQVLDSVVVHELCHLKQMNHSKAFYAEVLRVFPEYRKWNKWLKDNGPMLYAMLPEQNS